MHKLYITIVQNSISTVDLVFLPTYLSKVGLILAKGSSIYPIRGLNKILFDPVMKSDKSVVYTQTFENRRVIATE